MLKRAERLGMSRLVRNTSLSGSAATMSSCGFGSGCSFLLLFHRLVVLFLAPGEVGAGAESVVEDSDPARSGSGPRLWLRNFFMVLLNKLVDVS